MPIAKINETELYFIEHGSGDPFLVLQGGLGFDHTYFRPVLDPLGEIVKLIFVDFRGHGRSGRPAINTITYEQIADDVNELREFLGYDKVGVIGHSAGGFVALKYAIRHPKNISNLILIDTAPAFDYMDEMMAIVQRKNPTPEILATLDAPAAPTAEGFKQQLKILNPLYFFDFNPELKEEVEKKFAATIVNPEAAALNEVLMPKYNVRSKLSKIEVPTLILVGKEDFVCPPSQAQHMHDVIPNSKLTIFERCSHYPFLEVPDEFFRVMSEWFKKHT
jgi:proline iminopeptidase